MRRKYLYQASPPRRSRQRQIPIAMIAAVVSFVVVLSIGYVAYQSVKYQFATFATELDLTASQFNRLDNEPEVALAQAQAHLRAARSVLQPYRPVANLLMPLAERLPSLQTVAGWWTFVDEATLAGESMLTAAQIGVGAAEAGQLSGLLAQMPRMAPALAAAQDHFLRAQAARSMVDSNRLPARLANQADTLLSQWDTLAPMWQQSLAQASRLAQTLPPALGSPRPVTYLIIIQSSDNLRATGGFLTSVGTMRLEQGRIIDLKIRDVTEAEFSAEWTPESGFLSPRIVPPDPVRRYLGLGHWVMRDGNWWADFPTTARQVTQFWQLAGGQPVDGVIGVTDQAIADLLVVAGPLSLPDGQTLDVKNMRVVAASNIHSGQPSPVNKQSAFFQEVAASLAPRLEQLPFERWPFLIQQFQTMARRHDLLITSFDPTLAVAFHELGIDGALQGQTDDYVYLVEDNLADSKLNSFVTQQLHYEVQLNPDGAAISARLLIQKKNGYVPGTQLAGFPLEGYYTGGRWDAQTQQWDKWEGYYGGYLRLFPPPDSHLINATGFDDPVDTNPEHNRSVFGGYVGMWAGTQRDVQFEWTPGGRPQEPGRYRLLVQRQPGTLDQALTVQVNLPAGYRAVAVNPALSSVTEQAVVWQTVLDRDRIFELRLER